MTIQTTGKNNEHEPPLVSVVMPAYNCAKYISKAINSILNQSFKDFELLITDDASTDNTWQEIQKFTDPRIKLYKNTKNIGYLKTINSLFEHAKGEFIAFQDADDWSHKNRFNQQLTTFKDLRDISLCGSFCFREFNEDISVITKYPTTNHELTKQLNHGRTSLFCGASIMFKKEILNDIGSYREVFDRIGAEDIDWFIRALEKYKAANIPLPLYHYRQHTHSITQYAPTNSLKQYSADIALAYHLIRKNGDKELLNQSLIAKKILPAINISEPTTLINRIYKKLRSTPNQSHVPYFYNIKKKLRTSILKQAFGSTVTNHVAKARKNRAENIYHLLVDAQDRDLVSVYIPTHNRAHDLRHAVESVLSQSYSPIEIIISNDGSTDNTESVIYELAKQHVNIKYINHPKPMGACHARNTAINISTGKYVTGLDDDDRFTPNRIEELVYHYKPDYAFTCSEEYSTVNGKDYIHIPSSHTLIDIKCMRYSNEATGYVLTERKKIIDTGLFDERLPSSQDYDMWLRMVVKYGSGYKVQKPLVIVNREHERERISTSRKKTKGFRMFLDKHRNIMSFMSLRAQNMRITKAFKGDIDLMDFLRSTTHKTIIRDFKWLIKGLKK